MYVCSIFLKDNCRDMTMKSYMWMITLQIKREMRLSVYVKKIYVLRLFLMLKILAFTEMYFSHINMQQGIVCL